MEDLNARSDVNTIVFEGAGKAFVAGADVKFFVDMIGEDSFDKIEEFTKDGHRVLNMIEDSPSHHDRSDNGMALGGGLELARPATTGWAPRRRCSGSRRPR